jgi:nuclear control of ATPase protein 2
MFPHLQQETALSAPSLFFWQENRRQNASASLYVRLMAQLNAISSWALRTLSLPIELAGQECRSMRRQLEELRDGRVRILGQLAQARTSLSLGLEKEQEDQMRSFYHHLRPIAMSLQDLVNGTAVSAPVPLMSPRAGTPSLLEILDNISSKALPINISNHSTAIQSLKRPSRLTLAWPRLLLIPPLALFTTYSLYASRASVSEFIQETKETVRGFFVGWLVQPMKEVLNTVRARGDEGVIVHKESINADLDVGPHQTWSFPESHLK